MNQEKKSADESIGLDDEARVVEVLKTSVFGLWQVVNNLTRLRPSRRERYTVAIFGSARVERDHWVYEAVRDVSAEIPHCVTTEPEVMAILRAHHSDWQRRAHADTGQG